MKVAQVMKQQVKTCHAQETLNTAAQIMWDHDCGSVPVVDSDGRVIGMITDRDICMAAYTHGGPLRALQVKDAMSKNVCACQPQDGLADAERIMRANQVHRLPVIDAGNRLVGILSLNDLAEEAGHEVGAKKREITFAEIGETLEAVCKPRGSRAIAVAV
jgi:CBS-domain-containing membrane protein